MSSRFSKSIGKDVLKVLYSERDSRACLLGFQLQLGLDSGFDEIIVVSGYKAEAIQEFVDTWFPSARIQVVYNNEYLTTGTCKSFACGVEALELDGYASLTYMEGDLYLDRESFQSIVSCHKDIITANRELIRADTSVVFYLTEDGRIHFNYDVHHKTLRIDQKFTMLGNSGQVWKFTNLGVLRQVVKQLDEASLRGTNLIPISAYFNAVNTQPRDYIVFDQWVNCNAIEDYRLIATFLEG